MRRVANSSAALLVCLFLTGCGGDHGDGAAAPAPGPPSASSTERHRAQCTPSDAEGEIILQPGSLTPDGDLTLVSAELDSPVNLEVVEQDVVRFTGRSTISGIIRDYPPLKTAGLADSLADWDQRRPLEGLEIGPGDGQQAVLVAVRLSDPSKPGHLNGVNLTTSEGETAYAQPVLVEPPDALCTVAEYDSTLDWVP